MLSDRIEDVDVAYELAIFENAMRDHLALMVEDLQDMLLMDKLKAPEALKML